MLHLKKPIKNLCDEKDSWEEYALSSSEWKLVEGGVKCLKPVKVMMKNLEGEKEPTMDKVISEIFNVQTALRTFINTPFNCGYGITFAKELKAQIEIRFPEKGTDRVQRRMANYLSPKFRGAHLDQYGKLESTKQEIEAKIRSYENVPDETETEELTADAGAAAELSPNSKLIKRHQAKLQRERTRGQAQNKIRKEMERYESFSFPDKKANILFWWKQHEGVLPLLASLAKRILAIPASSSKSERVFSTGGNIVTAKRNRLSPKNVECLIVIKENMAMVESFMQKGGYTIKKYENETNPFAVIDIEETYQNPDDEDEDGGEWEDLDDQKVVYLDDDVDVSEADTDDSDVEPDLINNAFVMID